MAIGYLKGRRIGWWEIDNASSTISNTASGQRIRFDGALGGENPIRGAYRFTYADHDFTYPIVAIRHLRANSGAWVIDHEKSAALWQHETGSAADLPSYGLWRRVDEAVIDALCCWREIEPSTWNMDVKATGGWLNGTWQYRLSRAFDGRVYEHPSDLPSAKAVLAEPTEPAPIWQFVDGPRTATRVELNHVQRLNGKLPYLAPEALLEGFQDKTPYLMELTSGAVLFPAYTKFRWVNFAPRGQVDGPDELIPSLYFTYADDQAFITFEYTEHGKLSTTSVADFGLRHDISLDPHIGAESGAGKPIASYRRILCLPSTYGVWRKFTLALQDAWFEWQATSSKIPTQQEDFDAATEKMRAVQRRNSSIEATYRPWNGQSVDLPLAGGLGINGRFVAGVYRNMNNMRAELTPVLSTTEQLALRALEDSSESLTKRPPYG